MQDKLYNMLLQEDEITWQTIIYDLVKSEEMDPWDIDISLLAKRYLETLKKLKEMNFNLSGKIVLASAILLKLKTRRLVEEDLARFENIINPPEELDNQLYDDIDLETIEENKIIVIPKTPQPRRRKVSVNDLVSALQKALEVNKRRVFRRLEEVRSVPQVEIPEKKIDISEIIKEIHSRIISFFKSGGKKLTFDSLLNSPRREDKIALFVPLLHLDTQRKINLHQKEHFGEIEILMK
ncbi:MAG: segregation/condensation protein A [Nanoarchaeota archaeon]|nr:segregation/condensation protein A [Nanoarchaeota archaeon]